MLDIVAVPHESYATNVLCFTYSHLSDTLKTVMATAEATGYKLTNDGLFDIVSSCYSQFYSCFCFRMVAESLHQQKRAYSARLVCRMSFFSDDKFLSPLLFYN